LRFAARAAIAQQYAGRTNAAVLHQKASCYCPFARSERDPSVQIKFIIRLAIAALAAALASSGNAQQPSSGFFNSYQGAIAGAADKCHKLWADPVFDPLRDKVPLGAQKPTMEMLTSTARLEEKDRPLARQAITVVLQCRMAYAPAYDMLPEPAQTLIEGLYREEDALIAQLYTGKITFGEFNVGENRLVGEILRAFSTTQQSGAQAPAPPQRDANPPVLARDTRLALVIGNGNYMDLPKLANPKNDAEAIAEVLDKLGYGTRLLLNATEQELRREVRKFAAESNKADVALVFYAGHGAQLNGENYLLPTDIDIPRTEADIQLSGLKVDDLVNSVRSATKIVFLDACRDNPALFKNLVKGRGGRAAGLAPTVGSNLDPGKPGGGIFIAYATDSGSIAADGSEKHSPFTQALLRYLKEPVSIDDMFSLVTKEVRLATNNTQRPYKYASLEAIVCLTGPCSGSNRIAPALDIVQEIKRSEAEELQIALRTNSATALQAYLEKYPETGKRRELLATISRMRRAEFTEWTLYEVSERGFPQYVKLGSIKQISDRVAMETRHLIDPVVSGEKYPNGSYREDLMVIHCAKPLTALAESKVIDPAGKTLYAYKWADPAHLDLTIGTSFAPGSIASSTQKIMCSEGTRTPLLGKKELAAMKFSSLSSTISGDGDMFYALTQNEMTTAGVIEVNLIAKLHNEIEIDLSRRLVSGAPLHRTQVSRIRINCANGTMAHTKGEYYDTNNNLVYFDTRVTEVNEISNNSPVGLLRRIVCNSNEAGK
jgi:Caspase domain